MRSRQFQPYIFCVLFNIACGPGRADEPAETDGTGGDPSTSSGADTLTGEMTLEPPNPTTGGPEPSTGSTETTGSPDPTESPDPTGGPVECPGGQVPFAPRWSTVLAPPFEFAQVHPEGGMAVMGDGRLAIGVKLRDGEPLQSAGGVLFLSPTGELLGVHPGAFTSNGPIFGLARAANEELVMAGRRLGDDPPTWIARFGGDGALLADLPGSALVSFEAALGLLDTPVLLGLDELSAQMKAVKFVADSAEPEWARTLSGPLGMQSAAVATREDGSALLVTQGDPTPGGYSWLGLEVVDSAGATVWAREIDGPEFGQVPHAIAIPDGWAVLQTGQWPAGVVRLMAVSAVDGATLWDAELAAPDALGPPIATRVHRTGEHLTVPVLRSLAEHPVDFSDTRTVAAHRLTLQGAPIDVTPLEGAAAIDGSWDIDSTLGACDELIVLAPGGDLTWVGGFTP